jgi:hypothetical protein
MDKAYIEAVKLMLRIAPDVFEGTPFALKGGTAINLFVREMPRLSVDLDLVYVNRATPRQTALEEITASLQIIARRLEKVGLSTRKKWRRIGEEITTLAVSLAALMPAPSKAVSISCRLASGERTRPRLSCLRISPTANNDAVGVIASRL